VARSILLQRGGAASIIAPVADSASGAADHFEARCRRSAAGCSGNNEWRELNVMNRSKFGCTDVTRFGRHKSTSSLKFLERQRTQQVWMITPKKEIYNF
jgi:hypothetical protein